MILVEPLLSCASIFTRLPYLISSHACRIGIIAFIWK